MWKEAANSLEMPGVRRALVCRAVEKLFPEMAQISDCVLKNVVLTFCLLFDVLVINLHFYFIDL